MFKNLKNNIFRKRAQKFLSLTPREHRFVSYDKAKKVLLLFESDYSEKNPAIRKIVLSLQEDGKKVTAWGFVDKKETASAILPDFQILHHKQTDWSQKPDSSLINQLQEMKFDLLIDLSLRTLLPLQYLAMYANASLKAGIRHTDLPVYDFILDLEKKIPSVETTETEENPVDETYLFNQIIFYLKSIQTND